MNNAIVDFLERTSPITSSVATALGAYWFLMWFTDLNQQDYMIVVALAAVTYLAIVVRGDE